MSDCHIDTYGDIVAGEGMARAQVILTATGQVLYTTWPYRNQGSAITRARRWIEDEYGRLDAAGGLFQ